MKKPTHLDTPLLKSKAIVTRKVAGEIILVPIIRQINQDASLYTLDDLAAFLWEQLDQHPTARQLGAMLQEHYDVETSRAEADIQTFIDQLLEIGALEINAQPVSAIAGETH